MVLAFSLGCSGESGGTGPAAADGGPTSPGGDGGSGGVDAGPPAPSAAFDPTILHEVDLTVDAMYLEQLEHDRENRVPCTIVFDGVTVTNAGIRQKGGYGSSSNLSEKPAFSLKFNEFVPGQRLLGLRKLLLNNALEDPTLLSEHIGYEAYREAGLPATLTSHGVVTLNGMTYGIYVVKEAIAEDFLERNFGESYDEGNIYEGVFHPDDQSLGDFVLHPEALELKDELEDMRSRDDVRALAALISDTPDADFVAAVSTKLDLDRYLTGFALDTILGYWDSYAYYLNNYYLYDHPQDGRFVYLPHGMDQLQYEELSSPMGRLAQRVHEIPELEERFVAELARLRAAWPAEAMATRLERARETVHSTTRTDERTLGDLDGFDASYDQVRDKVAGLGTPP